MSSTQSSTEESTAPRRRRYYTSDAQTSKSAEMSGTRYNFISFLSTVQKAGVPLLQLTWQSYRQSLGGGATGNINDAQTSLETSFAFKRIPDDQKMDKEEGELYEHLITEMLILSHPTIRRHPNVVELQGVCWDISRTKNLRRANESLPTISGGFSVWPVLVFDKAEFGDLYTFLASAPGRRLNVHQRLEMCITIGQTIADLHTFRIIHGDIKPQNVLVFKGDNGFHPRVADFGFSIPNADPDTRIVLPSSKPWVAPEHSKQPEFDLEGAIKADLFSFGLVCLWLLFEKQLSGILPLPDSVQRPQDRLPASDKEASMRVLLDLKQTNALDELFGALIAEETALGAEEKEALANFFRGSLNFDPELRHADIDHSLEVLAHLQPEGQDVATLDFEMKGSLGNKRKERLRVYYDRLFSSNSQFRDVDYGQAVQILGQDRLQTQPDIEEHTPILIDLDMELSGLLHILYTCDYRVREHVFMELQASNTLDPNKATETQIALCRKLGFGTRDDVEQDASTDSEVATEVETQLTNVRNSTSWVNGSLAHAYSKAANEGLHQPMANTVKYGKDGVLPTAEEVTRREVKKVEEVLGADNRCTLYLKSSLVALLDYQARWQEAEELQIQVNEGLENEFGPDSDTVVGGKSLLCSIYQNLGRWKDAEQMESEVAEAFQSQLHGRHAQVLDAMLSLSKAKMELDRWDEAERQQLQVLAHYRALFGEYHETTLNAMETLVKTHCGQHKWDEAETLALEVIRGSEYTYGRDSVSTMYALRELARTYQRQGLAASAQERFLEALEMCNRTMGPEDPVALALLSDLATIREETKDVYEALESHVEVVEKSKRVLGPEHPDTLARMKKLATVYAETDEEDLAEPIALELLEKFGKTMGPHHTLTLETMSLLAMVYLNQLRFDESETLHREATAMYQEQLGEKHPEALRSKSLVALVLTQRGRFKDAQALQEEVLDELKSSVGEDHPTTLLLMYELTRTYAIRGRLSDATEMIYDCKERRAKVLGPDHPDTKASIDLHEGILSFEYEMLQYLDPARPMTVTPAMLLAAAKSTCPGVFPELVARSRGQVPLSSEMVEAVAWSDFAYPMLAQLVDEYGDEVEITEEITRALSSNTMGGGQHLLKILQPGMNQTTELLEGIDLN